MAQSSDMLRALSSIQVLVRFGMRVMLLMGFAAFSSVGFAQGLAALLWMAIMLCAVVGLLRREPPFGTVLNHWDEAVAFGALFALVHVAGQLA